MMNADRLQYLVRLAFHSYEWKVLQDNQAFVDRLHVLASLDEAEELMKDGFFWLYPHPFHLPSWMPRSSGLAMEN